MNPPLLLYRLGNFLHRYRIPILPKSLTWLNRLIFACMVPSSATIGRNFTLGYWGLGTVIHSNAIIGDDCWVMQNVTIGRKAGSPGVPRLGRNIAVGAGAVIIGNLQIGDNCIIGANSVVTRSFPCNCVIAGVPARVIGEVSDTCTTSHYLER